MSLQSTLATSVISLVASEAYEADGNPTTDANTCNMTEIESKENKQRNKETQQGEKEPNN